MTNFTFAEGETVRLDRSIPGRVMRNNLNGTVELWTEFGQRTVEVERIGPAKKDDKVMAVPEEWRPRGKAGRR